ncbi:MAG: hypothetical protein KGQ56_02040 [Acidobacteria bacterium]|nr:hypothetical protein [Acidobacteriota bacterium]
MLKLALTTKWIVALFLCLLMAAVFALLAQWQIARSILPNSGSNYYSKVAYLPLEEVSQPGEPFIFQETTKQGKHVVLNNVIVRAKLFPQDAVLVNKRVQLDGTQGSWIVVPATTENGRLFIAVGFVEDPAIALQVLDEVRQLPNSLTFKPMDGRYLPTEAPLQQINASTFESMSIAQLVNYVNWEKASDSVYPGFLALTKVNTFTSLKSVEPLTIGLAKTDSGVNWLSLFYALEWTAFALFAIFMWWRLLADAYRKQQEALLEQSL